jgi:predicted extracellular nuclease
VGGPADGLASTDIGVQEAGDTPVGQSLQLVGTGTSYADFAWSGPIASSYGAVNAGQSFGGGVVPPDAFINEIHYDNASTDVDEAIEIAGPAGTDLAGWSIALYNGSGGAVYDTTALSGAIPDQDNGYGTLVFTYPSNGIQNGSPDGIALVAPGDVVVQFLSYEGTFTAVGGPADGLASTDIGVQEAGDTPVGQSLQLVGTGASYADFAWSGPVASSYGAVNAGQSFGGGVTPPAVLINEVDSDTPSYDVLEFIELYDGGAGSTALDGIVVVLYNGSNDTVYDAFDLDGYTTDADGYFVIGTVPEADLYVDPGSSGWLQNGADAVAVYAGDGADFPNGAAITTDGLLDAIVYDTDDADDPGLLVLLNAGQPQVNENGAGDKDNDSNQRCPNGAGGARNTDSYQQYPPTPGAENTCGGGGPAFGSCGDPATLIHEVQGSGPDSPLNGSTGIVVEGVVVGDFQDTATQLGGFFVQEEDADVDADPLTSEGLFVYDGGFGVDVVVGDVVRVQGNVTEYYGLTELNGVSNLAVCDTGVSVTAAVVSLPVPDLAQWETYEGMLITIPQTLYATDNYDLGHYGEVSLSVGARLATPTNVVSPGPDAIALQDLNDRSSVLLDDGSNLENPLPLPPYIGADDTLRAGDTTPGLTGALAYGFGSYRVQPTQPVVFTRVNERTAAPQPVGGRLKVASFNVLNYFNGDGMGGGFPTSRGAGTLAEFVHQRDKIVSAALALDADVVGLIEIENDGYGPNSAIADLVSGLNDVAGPGTYAYVDPGVAQIGTDEIAVGFVYKPAAVTPVGAPAILDSSVDPTFIDTKNRPALAQTFEEDATGERFTVVVNHFKSKGSDCNDIGDPDLGDGQGNCPATRTSAALALTNWLATDPTALGDPDFLIVGDLNSYAMEDPIAAIEGAGYTNLIETFVGPDAYSYVYYGQAGYLDHALASPGLAPQVTGAAEWHINSDEPSALDYNDYNQPALYHPDPYRSSDHDPVLVGLDLFSAKPLEDVSLQLATIHWMPFGDEQARFLLEGEFDLPAGFARGDLSRDLTLCVTIAGETGCDTVTFTQHGSVWLYQGADGAGSGMDISHAIIVWPRGKAAIAVVQGEMALPGVDQDTTPAEATVTFSLPVEAPGPTSELFGEVFVAFETHRRLWLYQNW